ncbi:YesN/AraC family two-component response regulator [Cytobacillus eiseniae]|uniref:YesN/AraC family two-component response regulator n=1 Tax=Cytobacillus eiseniae TaxID=762947 RepID=A0ABS4RI96_9BACI|nr:helix-turn-helix domain-containing protein [Cytobacillus eiseniae]MBP2242449.1 YesN/AraC family two-component response regulator [Cytobacillus eiseniae]
MDIHVMAKDLLEAQGIRWVLESHLTGINVTLWDSTDDFIKAMGMHRPDLVIFDMDLWENGGGELCEILHQRKIQWIGISSERIFQTAYRALRYRAEDVLFRPISPEDLKKPIQQIRYQSRQDKNSFMQSSFDQADAQMLDYPDLFLTDNYQASPITMVAFLTPNTESLQYVYEALQSYSFPGKQQIFALSEFILCVQENAEIESIREVYHSFLSRWKERMDEPLAIVIHNNTSRESLKKTYQQTRQLTKTVFFEGYDIILEGNKQMEPLEMDPFLTPLEQRQWIEMLETRNTKAIREWVEREFLTYERPYPDPEMVRIRLTSVLAQIRRHMKSYNLLSVSLEASYHEVFKQIIHQSIIYQIVKELLTFIQQLLLQVQKEIKDGPQSLVEKVQEMIELNYWDAGWNLAACAEALRINKSTLSRRFSMESGQTFRIFLHQVRIREAKRLLLETDLSLDEVSRLTGYAHQTYFNSKFKQLEGCTPSAYRTGIERGKSHI